MQPGWYASTGSVPNAPGIAIVPAGTNRTVRALGSKRIAVIGAFGWGPRAEKYLPSSSQDAMKTFWPLGPDAGGSFVDFQGLPWPALSMYQPDLSGGVAASVTCDSKLDVAARKKGASGNGHKIIVTANADDATVRDVRIEARFTDQSGTVHAFYNKTYKAVQAANGTVTDPGDPYFSFAKHTGASSAAAAGTYTLASGVTGTLTDADVTAALAAYNGDTDVAGFVILGAADGDREDINVALTAWAESADRAGRWAVLTTPAGKQAADGITDAGTWDSAGVRLIYPRVQKTAYYVFNGLAASYSGDADGAPVLAAAYAQLDPHASAFASTFGDLKLTAQYTALESGWEVPDRSTLGAMSDAGVMAWTIDKDFGGLVPHDDLTTGLDASGVPIRGFVQRYGDDLATQAARIGKRFASKPLDIDLANTKLGVYSTQLYGALVGLLRDEERKGLLIPGLNSDSTTSPAFAVDMYGSQDSDLLAQGQSRIRIDARITPNLRVLIFLTNTGTVVEIASAS